ncbi:MAG: M56 family metallopeptidase [Acidobacteria bacterium]|nr:M56 family metallopeptidase [Acidobacteriota bacterium]
MPDNVSLAIVSSALTYFLQITCAYLLAAILCRFVESARVRMWLWSGFLLVALCEWLAFLALPLGLHVAESAGLVPNQTAGPLRWTYRLEGAFSSQLSLWTRRGLGIYVGGAVAFLLVLGYRRFLLQSLLRGGQPPSPEISFLFRRLATRMKVQSCQIILVPQLRCPSMVGWLRAWVLLPRDLLPHLRRRELIEVLLHELIHVRRRDYLWNQLAGIACRVVFFHPAVWLAHRHMRRERELACDQAMGGKKPERRLRYAECLMGLAKWWFLADRYSTNTIGVSTTASFLATRVRILLEPPPRRSFGRKWLRVGVVSLIALAGAYGLFSLSIAVYTEKGKQVDGIDRPGAWRRSAERAARAASIGRRRPLPAKFTSARDGNVSRLRYDPEFAETLTYTDHSRRPGNILTPNPDVDQEEATWSTATNEPRGSSERKPIWNEGSIENSPMSLPAPAAAADIALRVAIGIAAATRDDDFITRH